MFLNKVVNHVLLRDPSFERHATGASNLKAIAIRSWPARIRRETSVSSMERDEFLEVVGRGSSRRCLLNHLICPEQQRRGDREPERLGGLEVDRIGRLS